MATEKRDQSLVHGDVVGSRKITYERMGDQVGVAVGRGAEALAGQPPEISPGPPFHRVYAAIDDQLKEDPPTRARAIELVRRLEWQLAGSTEVDLTALERSLRELHGLVPPIFDLLTDLLVNPTAGLAAVTRDRVATIRMLINAKIDTPTVTVLYVKQRVTELTLPPELVQHVSEALDILEKEVARRQAANVRLVERTIRDLAVQAPELRQPIRYWLLESEGVDGTIKLIASQLLTPL